MGEEKRSSADPSGLPLTALPFQGRHGAVYSWYFQKPGLDQKGSVLRYSSPVRTDENPHQRNLRVSQEWKPLDLGYFAEDGSELALIILSNEEGKFLSRNPTDEEKKEVSRRVVEVGVIYKDSTGSLHVERFAYIHPGRFLPLCPSRSKGLMLRCQSGTARVATVLIPG